MGRIKTKYEVQIEQQILFNLSQIVESFPQYNVAKHLIHFLRTKGDAKDPYYWTDEFLLKRIEEYHDELKNDLSPAMEEGGY